MKNALWCSLTVLIPLATGQPDAHHEYDRPLFKSDSIPVSDPRAAEVIKTVCPGASTAGAGEAVPCMKVCPSYTDFPGEEFGLDATGVVFGHFLQAGAYAAIVSVSGCESHASLGGGSYLLAQHGAKWRIVWFKSGIITTRCHIVHRNDGLDVLLCDHNDGAQGNRFRELSIVDPLEPTYFNSPKHHSVFSTGDSTRACAGHFAGPETIRPTIESGMTKVEFLDLNGDGLEDMRVYAYFGQKNLTDAEIKACEDFAVQKSPTGAVRIPWNSYVIDFIFDGKSFRVAPESRKAAVVFGLK